uniref:ovochymase-2-like n=1 Tax=Styela clava TaxID=7725 RepID=UPI00193A6424|nr:ovochymase-2-like [Styela clava]
MLKTVSLLIFISSGWLEVSFSTQEAVPVSCGYSEITSNINSRIVNGTEAVRGRWPWQAMILRREASNRWFRHICGGTLIAKQWVVTAAHCNIRYPPSEFHVSLGRIYLSDDRNESSKITLAVMSVHRHPAYHRWANAHDIALFRLAHELTFNEYLKPACLPTPSTELKSGQICTVTGWGETKGTGSRGILREASVSIIDRDSCVSWYQEELISIPENHTCAGHEEGLIDSCQGDSGGPLVCSEIDQRLNKHAFVLRGVTSFGSGCARRQRPGVYTTVSKYVGWIKATLADHSTFPDECTTARTSHINSGGLVTGNGTIIRPPINPLSGFYQSNTDITWDIAAPPDKHIILEFICLFNLQGSLGSCNDYVNISSKLIGHEEIFCGMSTPSPITIKHHITSIQFHSDSSKESFGFVLRVTFSRKETSTPTTAYHSSTVPMKHITPAQQPDSTIGVETTVRLATTHSLSGNGNNINSTKPTLILTTNTSEATETTTDQLFTTYTRENLTNHPTTDAKPTTLSAATNFNDDTTKIYLIYNTTKIIIPSIVYGNTTVTGRNEETTKYIIPKRVTVPFTEPATTTSSSKPFTFNQNVLLSTFTLHGIMLHATAWFHFF